MCKISINSQYKYNVDLPIKGRNNDWAYLKAHLLNRMSR